MQKKAVSACSIASKSHQQHFRIPGTTAVISRYAAGSVTATTISHDQGCYVLAIEEYSQLENVMAALRMARTQVLELQILQLDLEEVFVKIMHGAESLESASA